MSPEITSSTRRFCCRPAAVSLDTTGRVTPKPSPVTELDAMPCTIKKSRTEIGDQFEISLVETSEIDDLKDDLLGGSASLTYLRYNVDLEEEPLRQLGTRPGKTSG